MLLLPSGVRSTSLQRGTAGTHGITAGDDEFDEISLQGKPAPVFDPAFFLVNGHGAVQDEPEKILQFFDTQTAANGYFYENMPFLLINQLHHALADERILHQGKVCPVINEPVPQGQLAFMTDEFIEILQIGQLPEMLHRYLIILGPVFIDALKSSLYGLVEEIIDVIKMGIKSTPVDPRCLTETGNPDLIKRCPKCGGVLTKRSGRYGKFWGCSGYPECRYTRNL